MDDITQPGMTPGGPSNGGSITRRMDSGYPPPSQPQDPYAYSGPAYTPAPAPYAPQPAYAPAPAPYAPQPVYPPQAPYAPQTPYAPAPVPQPYPYQQIQYNVVA